MIAKISTGAKVAGLANYLHGPGRENEHAYGLDEGGAVIGGNLMVEGDRDGHRWARDMNEAAHLRPDIGKPVWHMSLRAAPEDPVLTDAQWRDVAQTHAETMGWADRPWVMVRHGEDHVHVVVSRVGFDGTVWTNRNDRYLARDASLRVEKDLGLRSTALDDPNRRRTTTRTKHLTQGEFAAAERTGKTPPRAATADLVRAARDHAVRIGGGRENFEAALSEVGVRWRANIAKTGKMSGYSFHVPGHVDAAGEPLWWKASDLDRSLAWGRLSKDLTPHQVKVHVRPVEPRRTFERPKTYQARVEQAHAAAVREVRDNSGRQLQGQLVADRTGSSLFWQGRQKNRAKKTQQWVQNVELRATKRAELADAVKRHRVSFPEGRAARRALIPTSATFRAGLKAVEWSRHLERAVSIEEPRRGHGLSR